MEQFAEEDRLADYKEATVPFLFWLAGSVIVICIAKDIPRVGLHWDWVFIRIFYVPLAAAACLLPRFFKKLDELIPEFAVWVSGAYIVWFCTKFSMANGYFKSDYVFGLFQYFFGIALMPLSRFTFFGFMTLSSFYFYWQLLTHAPNQDSSLVSQSISNYVSFYMFAALVYVIISKIRSQKSQFKRELYKNLQNQDEVIAHQAEEISKSNVYRTIASMTQMLSHDLRAPLNTFEKILHIPPSTPVGTLIVSIRESLNRVYGMIESLLHMDLETIVKRNSYVLRFEQAMTGLVAKAESRSIRIVFPEDFEAEVNLDSMKFERAWVNLASNAIDFAISEVWIEVETEGNQLILRVMDDGPGVSEDFVPKLFQRGATDGKANGTGLGLAYARQIMRGHGGDVIYRREHGLTIFECRLPQACVTDSDWYKQKSGENKEVSSNVLCQEIAICLMPESLAEAVEAVLSSHQKHNFIFTREYSATADLVVTNDDEILFRAMDEDKKMIQIKVGLTQTEILDRLIRKFNLS